MSQVALFPYFFLNLQSLFLPIAHWSHLRCSGLVNTDGLYSAGLTDLGSQAPSWTVDWRWWRPPACGRFDYMLLRNSHRLQQCSFHNCVLFLQKPHRAPHTLPAARVRLHLPKLWQSLTLWRLVNISLFPFLWDISPLKKQSFTLPPLSPFSY